MSVPYRTFLNLLSLAESSFEVVDETGGDEEGQSDVVDGTSGGMLQEDTRKSEIKYTVKAVVKIAADAEVGATNRPKRGLHTGLSGVIYFVDSVKVPSREKHKTMTVDFHRFLDVAASQGSATATQLVG